MTSISLILLLLCVFAHVHTVTPVKCTIGYGQTGKRYSNEITWIRTCPQTDYCFKAITTDIRKVRKLIDYPWDSYYGEFWIKSCGGDYGMPAANYHPWRGLKRTLGSVKVNLTVPMVITGQGGREQFDLGYTCRHDLCSKVTSSASSLRGTNMAVAAILSLLALMLLPSSL